MTGEQDELLRELKNQVHLLMTQYTALKKANEQLRIEKEGLEEQVSVQKVKIETLEQQYNTAKMATSVLAKDIDKEEARAEINKIVREIDDCIALLNR